MNFQLLLFFFYGTTLLVAATMVVASRNSVKSALYLVLVFFSAACIWILLAAEFLAIVLVLVYVGAVMVLFLFVVMMLDVDLAELKAGFTRYLPIGSMVAVLLLAEIILVLVRSFGAVQFTAPPAKAATYSNTRELGEQLYTWYVYPFEIAALILLVAIIAAIVLTLRRRPHSLYKRTDPSKQVLVMKKDRLKIVKMQTEQPSINDDLSPQKSELDPAQEQL